MRLSATPIAVLMVGFVLWPPAAPAFNPAVGETETHVVRLFDKARTDTESLGLSPVRTLDYGSFVWLELTPTDFATLQASGVEFHERTDPYTLLLGELEFDPLVAEPEQQAAWAPNSTDGPDFHLVQFAGPTRAEWLEDLESSGLEIVQYIPPHTYVVWGDPDARAGAGAVTDTVRWAGSFAPAYRVQPRWRNLPDQRIDVRVLIYRGADTAATLRGLEALGGKLKSRRTLNARFGVAGFSLSGAQFQAAARVPGVYTIVPVPTDGGLRGEMSDQVCVNNVDAGNIAFPGYLSWLAGVGISGRGVIIADVDGGVNDNHPDLLTRMLPCSGSTCGGSAQSSHGSHTAGIMAADGRSGATDSFGFLRGLGIAPGANLIEQLYSPFFTQPGGMLLLMTQSSSNGASLSGNSWGPAGTPRGYDDDTMQVDIGVRDADPDTPGNQPLTYVLSIMNGYGGTSSQGSPDEAKNILCIGSTKMQTGSGTQIPDINDLSANSAHGPALDGRKIPHLVAPGCSVDSTVLGSGYDLMCGTSMASPHVSGAVALFIEYYRKLPTSPPDPSPALVKAAFLPVAKDLAGFLDADGNTLGHRFDSKQGWGRMDVEAVVDPQLQVRYFDNPVVFDNSGEEWNVTVTQDDPAEPMLIMLVWTDAAGHGLGGSTPAWNNDLDLVVDADGDTYRGNWLGPDGWSVPGGSADGMNNTEGVLLGPTAPGAATVRVIAGDINSDGIPGDGDTTDQDFALVCYNCAEEPGFTLQATPASQDVCVPDDAVINIAVGQILGFSDPVTLGVTGEPAGTTIDFSVNPVTPPGASVLTIGNTGFAQAGGYELLIEGVAATMTRSTSAELNLYDAVPGTSTLILPADGATSVSLTPTFQWTAGGQGTEYDLEVATDAGFTNIVAQATGLVDAGHSLENPLERTTLYYWHVRAVNVCGAGEYSAPFSFTTRDIPSTLLVDDDDDSPDVRSYYTAALSAIGQDYDIWDTNNADDEPSATDLAPYSLVIWFTGDKFDGTAGPGGAGEAALGSFLDNGTCLFISSQDYHWDRGLTAFMADYLGVASVTDDVSQSSVTGLGSIFGGMGPYSLSYPFSNYSDIVSPDGSAELAFSGNAGDAAVNKETGAYRTTFWGFPFEAIPSSSERNELLNAVVNWCVGSLPEPPLPEPGGPGCSVDSDCSAVGDRWAGAPCVAGTCYVPKNRYLSIDPTVNPSPAAYQVTVTQATKRVCSVTLYEQCEVDGDCPGGETCEYKYDQSIIQTTWWLEAPVCKDNNGEICPANSSGPHPAPCTVPADMAISNCSAVDGNGNEWMFGWYSSLGPKNGAPPAARLWAETPLHVGDCIIAPVITYEVAASEDGGASFGEVLEIMTVRQPNRDWADVTGGAVGDGPPAHWSPPNGVTNTTDSQAVIATFEQWASGYAPVCWADYTMDQRTDMADLQLQILAIEQAPGTEIYRVIPALTAPSQCP